MLVLTYVTIDYGHSSTEPAKGETLEDGRYARTFLKYALRLIEKVGDDGLATL
jgi:hypothetical protein